MSRLFLALALGATACSYSDPGGGSGTLEVIAEVTYYAEHDRTHVEVVVQKDGAPIEGAEVIFKDGDTGDKFTITEDTNGRGEPIYRRNDIATYRRRIRLEVTQGDDELWGQIEGPGPHTIEKPANHAQIDRSDDDEVRVEWATTDGIAAEQVILDTDNAEQTTTKEDTGHYDLPVSSFRNGTEFIQVTRLNALDLEGGMGSSRIETRYDARNTVTVSD